MEFALELGISVFLLAHFAKPDEMAGRVPLETFECSGRCRDLDDRSVPLGQSDGYIVQFAARREALQLIGELRDMRVEPLFLVPEEFRRRPVGAKNLAVRVDRDNRIRGEFESSLGPKAGVGISSPRLIEGLGVFRFGFVVGGSHDVA